MVKINPEDYQPEEVRKIDLSMTRHEKMQLILYLACILLGIVLMAGLFRSYEIVNTQTALIHNFSNESNVTALRNATNFGVFQGWGK